MTSASTTTTAAATTTTTTREGLSKQTNLKKRSRSL